MKLTDYDTVFISFDEPNAEENYQHLLTINPRVLRVHGVRGFAAAHRAAAELSITDRIIIVDGDVRIRPDFYEQVLEFKSDVDLEQHVISWPSFNPVNALCYGNGGIKCWPRELLLQPNHEETDTVEFDTDRYLCLNSAGGDTIINRTQYQAWRAGFREGVKLSLRDGLLLKPDEIDPDNQQRIWNWCHLGLDSANGEYTIGGARQALKMLSLGFDYRQINDTDYLYQIFRRFNPEVWLDNTPLEPESSMEYKRDFVNPPRSDESFLVE